MSLVDLESVLHRLADASGEAILPFFRTSLRAVDKSGGGGAFDPVTEADRAGEVAIRRLINESLPGHGIVGEEFGTERPDAEHRWVIDPIDGTRAFIAGLPVWGTLIGLMRGPEPVLGLMNQPFTRERFWGDGRRAHYRGPVGERPLLVRRTASLAEATIATTSPKLFATADLARYEAVERACRLARYGCDCYAYCMVAAGQIDLVIESGLSPYDIVALIPVIEGAGGVVTGWDGGPAAVGGSVVAAGDPRLHEQALRLLNG